LGAALCKLTLIYPPASEESLLAVIDELEPALPGFTTLKCDGHGAGFAHASPSERVRGRAERRCLMTVLPEAQAQTLLLTIKQEAPIPSLMYWIEPVNAAGRLQ